MALSSEVLNCFVAVETHLSGGSSDGVEMFVQSTVACFNVEDASVVHLTFCDNYMLWYTINKKHFMVN